MRHLLLFLLLLFPLSTPAQTVGPIQTDQTIDINGDKATDAAIDRRIRDILAEIEGYQGVEIGVHSGVVTASGEVLDRAAFDQLSNIIQRVDGVVALEMQVTEATDVAVRLVPAWERLQRRAVSAISFAPLIIVAAMVFAVITWVGFLATRSDRFWRRFGPNAFITDIYRMIARLAFSIAGLVLALDILNATALIGAVLGAAGVAGLAVGFAVRDTVENFISSVMLSIRQPFRPFDFVDIEGVEGTVARLTSRATILISADGNQIRIPNSTVFKGKIVNYTLNPHRRFDFVLGVDAASDLGDAVDTAHDVLNTLPFILKDPAPLAYIQDVGDSNVELAFQAWIDQRETNYAVSRGETIRATKTALEAAGFELPEPIYRVHLPDSTSQPKPGKPLQKAPPKPIDPTDLQDVSAPPADEDEMVRQVEEERAKNADNDLMREDTELE